METLRKINRVMYETRFSIFDLIWISIIGNLASTYSYWCFLMLLPVCAFSVMMERHLFKD